MFFSGEMENIIGSEMPLKAEQFGTILLLLLTKIESKENALSFTKEHFSFSSILKVLFHN